MADAESPSPSPVLQPPSAWSPSTWPVRIIPFVLAPLAILIMAVAAHWQGQERAIIALASLCWLALAMSIRMSPEARDAAYEAAQALRDRWVQGRWPIVVAVLLVVSPFMLLLVAE